MSMIVASVFRLGAPYPFDASFFLFLMSSCSALMYISTLLLLVKFRGDFGLLNDTALLQQQEGGRKGRSRSRAIGRSSATSVSSSLLRGLQELLRVPFDDLKYIVAPLAGLSQSDGSGRAYPIKTDIKHT